MQRMYQVKVKIPNFLQVIKWALPIVYIIELRMVSIFFQHVVQSCCDTCRFGACSSLQALPYATQVEMSTTSTRVMGKCPTLVRETKFSTDVGSRFLNYACSGPIMKSDHTKIHMP